MAAYNQSRIKMFRRCQKQYSFRYDYGEGGELIRSTSSRGLYLGSWMHELQQAHHQSWAGIKKANWEKTQRKLVKKLHGLFDEERDELGDIPELSELMFRGYLKFWKDDDERYTVAKLHNGKPAIEFVFEVSLEKWGIKEPFKGRIDLLVEDTEYGGLWIWDAKWVKNIPSSDERMMSPQALLYVWALRLLGYDVRGFVFNYARTKPPTVPHVLKAGRLSVAKKIDTTYEVFLMAIKQQHGDDWRKWVKHVYIAKLRELHARRHLWYRRERIPVEKHKIRQAVIEYLVTIKDIERRNLKNPPRSYFYNCKFNCDYHDLCVAEFQGMDITPLLDRYYEVEEERYGETTEDYDL